MSSSAHSSIQVKSRWKGKIKPLLVIRGTPHQLAFSFAFGVFLGILPGTGVLAAAFCAAYLRLILPVMVGGAALANPFTAPFIYGSSFLIGKRLLEGFFPHNSLLKIIFEILVGNFLLSLILALLGYLIAFCGVILWRSRLNYAKGQKPA